MFNVSFGQSVPNGITLSQSSDGLTINFTVPQFTFSDVKAEGTGYKLINVPDVMQATDYTCGPSSLSAVLNYYQLVYR